MTTAYSLHVGVQKYNSTYPGSANCLKGCINDMHAMAQPATDAGFPQDHIFTLADDKATVLAVLPHRATHTRLVYQ